MILVANENLWRSNADMKNSTAYNGMIRPGGQEGYRLPAAPAAIREEAVKGLPESRDPDRQTIPALLTLALIRCHYVPSAERTIRRWISSGIFPRPDISIGGKVRYWRRETVEGWIQTLAAEEKPQ